MNKLISSNYVKMGSYSEEDVKFLLKDLSNIQLEGSTETREKRIQSGEHYSESLPMEYHPPKEYLELFHQTLLEYKNNVALYVGVVAEQILKNKGEDAVLVSLARAGTPIGILIKRYIRWKYEINLAHYSISIIRGRGIDKNAIKYMLQKHSASDLQFVDGWTGKGAISKELTKSCRDLKDQHGIELDDTLAVVADPGHCTTLFGTRDDFLIPSACLNSTVSGLVSRTVLNDQYIGQNDFHGAKYYRELSDVDYSNDYLNEIASCFPAVRQKVSLKLSELSKVNAQPTFSGLSTVHKIMEEFNITDVNRVKPGVGETTRVLLRRVPWKILIKDMDSPYVKHILMLCNEKNVQIEEYPNMEYTCCGLIKNVR
ncbi:cysteine protease StiP family protein [Bacillus dakarensis]|uniref:cysteine protease StiP family protein n=1 Tax=Robertmurraya dakarensis TaxID=1926278 RepID=UPI000981401F|nr:cysteine protease StiP family protein [Bacillus dakarensis]